MNSNDDNQSESSMRKSKGLEGEYMETFPAGGG